MAALDAIEQLHAQRLDPEHADAAADGRPFGGANDVPAWGPYSYEKSGVSQGKLDGKHVHTSKLYEGMASDYWIYVPAQYNPSTPAAVMVWQDGEVLAKREVSRNLTVFARSGGTPGSRHSRPAA